MHHRSYFDFVAGFVAGLLLGGAIGLLARLAVEVVRQAVIG